MANKKLEVKDLTVSFRTTQGLVRAVRGVTFDLYEGETLAIVGESGSGKSVTSRAIMGILAGNGMIDKGSIIYEGEDLTEVDEDHFHEIRGNRIGMIFQDPMSSLNPIMRIGKQITEGMLLNGKHLVNKRKALYQLPRAKVSSLKRNIKKAKYTLKKTKADCKKEIELLKDAGNVKIAIKKAKKLTEVNITSTEINTKLTREQRKDHIITLRLELKDTIVNLQSEYAGKKAENEMLIAKKREENAALIAKVTTETKAKIAELSAQLPAAKAELNTQKAIATKKINEEWAGEQARVNGLIRTVSEEMKSAKASGNYSPEIAKEFKTKIAELKENLARYKQVTKKEAFERAIQVMTEVGIDNPQQRFTQYPFQFSGGMRQRIVIAIALTASPDVLICDEPTTALDVTIQAQILELINDLKKLRNLSVIFITHDLGVVANMADRIGVMYAGKVVELGTAEDVFYDPNHPYTWALLSSMPDLDSKERLVAIPGTPPNMLFPPKGDAFADRSSYAMKIDFEEQPPMFSVSETHSAATWLLHKDAPKDVKMPAVIQERITRMLKASEEVTK